VWNGKRYVVVCAGGHGKVDGSRLGGAVIAYAVEWAGRSAKKAPTWT